MLIDLRRWNYILAHYVNQSGMTVPGFKNAFSKHRAAHETVRQEPWCLSKLVLPVFEGCDLQLLPSTQRDN